MVLRKPYGIVAATVLVLFAFTAVVVIIDEITKDVDDDEFEDD